ncbi:amidase [Legionella erythra]|uniref:Amidase n=1 Tax=Legionella erythra TaxID=448 RepID=A0A0W0TV60_LEGER|nr:amidase [Legionella erythra]KTC99392.1 amidase [Legionella erythra]
MELFTLSASELIRKIKKNEILISDVAKSFIKRINEINPIVNALQQFDSETVLINAYKAEKQFFSSREEGKIFGLPLSVKDAFHVKDFFCSKGSLGLYKKKSSYDATVVSRLKAAGAQIYGITNTSELLLAYESDNLLYGRTNNPYDLARTAGGSSGGQAAIIALGGLPVGIGNDAGGSIRQPAHYCGICAHKPTHGLVPNTGNIPIDGYGIGSQLVSIGPMARYVEDLILLLDIISGPDGRDPHAVPVSIKGTKLVNLQDLRVAYFYNNPTGTSPTNETVQAVHQVVELLKPHVSKLEEVYPPVLNEVYRLHYETFMLGGDGGKTLSKTLSQFGQSVSPLTHEYLELAKKCNFSAADLRQRFIELERFRYAMSSFMMDYDLIISPIATTPARYHGETFANIRDFGYITAHNLTGWPATVIPCAFSKEGLPIGVQLVGKAWQDYIPLNVALFLQRSIGVFTIPKV